MTPGGERGKAQRDDDLMKPESVGADTLVRRQPLAGGQPAPALARGTIPPPVDVAARSSLLRGVSNRFVGPAGSHAPDDTKTSRNDREMDTSADHTVSLPDVGVHADAPTPANPKDLADASALIQLNPVGTRGPKGTAAFFIEAIRRGFVSAFPQTEKQLQQFVDDKSKSIHSEENFPTMWEDETHTKKVWDKKTEDKGKAAAKQKGLTITGQMGKYDVDLDQSPILESLVTVTKTRIERWRTPPVVGPKQVVLELGEYVRGDPGFGGSRHTTGNAIDVAFLNTKVSTEDQAIELIQDLPPGKRIMVFPDGDGVHVNIDGKGYDFGFGIEFFTTPFLASEQAREMKKAASAATRPATLRARGLIWGSTASYESTATWNGKEWSWSSVQTGSAEEHLKSPRLKAALQNVGSAHNKKP